MQSGNRRNVRGEFMKILLDTHVALWALADSGKLLSEVLTLLKNIDNEIYYSLASVWEIAIKHKIYPNKMPMSEETFVELCEEAGLRQLPITDDHIFQLKNLIRPDEAPPHNDPFDRIMIAQAKQEDMRFMTHDSLIPWYDESCIYYV